jgi:hypothetical protein
VITLWNAVYIERAVEALKEQGQPTDENLLQHLLNSQAFHGLIKSLNVHK